MPPLDIGIEPAVADRVVLGVIVLEDVAPRPTAPEAVEAEAREMRLRLEKLIAADARAKEELFATARRLYKSFGMDPTKHRPSSEQLARRVLRGDPFPRVNPLVDAVNLCQLEERIPYGLYDLDAIEPPVVAREGREGEEYAGIRKGAIHVAGRLALFDARGPFGNPSSDSDRAKTSDATRRALVVVFGSPGIDYPEWEKILERTAGTMLRHADARVAERRVVAGGGR